MITKTSLTHPTMIAKIRWAMKLAASGKGKETTFASIEDATSAAVEGQLTEEESA